MAILVKSDFDNNWGDGLKSILPDLDVRIWPDVGARDEIEYALVWRPEHGFLASLPNLKVIYSVGAGIDHLAADPSLPRHIPVVRMVDPALTQGMVSYVTWACLHMFRKMFLAQQYQAENVWDSEPVIRLASDRKTVGILGLGQLGQACSKQLQALDFDLVGWSATPKNVEGVTSYVGADGLDAMLRQTDYLVCLLPLTPDTQGILNKENMSKLKPEGGVVSAGRGGHLVEQDLADLLNAGHLSGAVVDVFSTEPLPQDNPLWGQKNLIITPHIASTTDPFSSGATVANSIKAFENGEALENLVKWDVGY
ncbi:MAG: 2-hydroxyacid dehydrogenase [Alphaproteobacteria bacterium]